MGTMRKKTPKNPVYRKRQNNLLYGSLDYNGTFTHETKIQWTSFDAKSCQTVVVKNTKALDMQADKVNWVHVCGLSDESAVADLCKGLGIEFPLVQDILNARHIAKLEDVGHCLFAVLDAYNYDASKELIREHQSIVLGENFILSFEEGTGHRFDPVLRALTDGIGQVRQHGADFLFNILVSLVVDSYYDVLEIQQDSLLNMEDTLMEFQVVHKNTGQQIQHFRRDHTRLMKAIAPLREQFGHLMMFESTLIRSESKLYYRDTYDHLQQVMTMLEANRETLTSLMDLYLANNDLRMNLIMKQLTVVGTIFLPLTFLVGVWGMNFKPMPELEMHNGYLYSWIVMIVIGILLYFWFRRKYLK
jgi:magnesium transporter